MSSFAIDNVTKYFEPHVHDCFQNALSSQIIHLGLNPRIVLADYLSFMYDRENGHIGLNYLFKPNTSVEFTEEELNTSLEFAYFPVPVLYGSEEDMKLKARHKDKINVKMFLENDTAKAYEHMKEQIDNGVPVVAAVDLFYMPYHRAYNKEHGLHYVVITGYNEEEGWLELFDKYRLSSSDFEGRLPIEQITMARNSENPLRNAVMGEFNRPIRNIWALADIGEDFSVSEEGIMSVINESSLRLKGERKVLGISSGLNILDMFRKDLLAKKEEKLDEKNLYLMKPYYNESFKTMSRSRKRFRVFINELMPFIPNDLIGEISDCLENSAKHWDICANVALKLAITKSMALIDNMDEQLKSIIDYESKAVEAFEKILARV